MSSKMTKSSGVDIDLGNRCSKNAYAISKTTFQNRAGKPGMPVMDVDGLFSSMIDFNGTKIGISSDGIGTKIELAERTGIYSTIGYDLLAMVADDLAAGGFVPTNISNIIDADFLDYDIIDSMMQGLKEACDFSDVAISGGEIAELGSRMNGYGDRMHFNWCSTAIGILHKSLSAPLDGNALSDGDAIISLRSRGFRSNGFSLLRKILSDKFGDAWHAEKYMDSTYGETVLTPSLIYSPLICALMDDGVACKGVVHVTGGGVADNLGRILKDGGFGAQLTNLFEPHDIMKHIQQLGDVSDDYAYRYWNMGNGMFVVVSPDEAEKVLAVAKENNYEACVAGTINKSSRITIVEKNLDYPVE
ncbi:MAG: AIR synthase-related protein [Spirochaetes bacterium]|jgi:phosphoribosylformylglycinamidine cyclo-ligase|nr:AIR synthase-related protein [Spirochaetota bacterium]